MKIKTIPFVPFTPKVALRMSKSFRLTGIANRAARTNPNLELNLYQAEVGISSKDYTSIALVTSVFWLFLIGGIFTFIGLAVKVPANFPVIAVMGAIAVSVTSYMYVINYPKIIVVKKVRELEKNLLFALRHLLIQVKSGVPLFDSMVSVSKSDYGLISKEFNEAVRKISTGHKDVEVLEEMTLKNPSIFFRRSMWQITNAIREGADIGTVLETIITSLANEQRVMVRQYGSQLNPLAFMYMMFGVIMPSLGISLIVTLTSFAALPIEPYYLWGIVAFLVIFKFNFLGIIKSRRPSIEVYE